MTRKEMNLRVFRREPLPHVFFQPRFEPWFAMHSNRGTLPEQLKGMSLTDVYDSIDASMRTVHYYTGQPYPIRVSLSNEVKVTERRENDLLKRYYDTPYGQLSATEQLTTDGAWRTVEFAAKTQKDLPALRWLMEHTIITFSEEDFKQGAQYIGDRGEPQFWVPKSPYMALAQQWMRFEDFIYALVDCPQQMEDVMKAIDDSYDQLYEQLTSSGLLNILNFGENIASAYFSMDYFERYLLPWYEKRSNQLRNAGIYTHIHIDGYFKPLLPYLKDLPFDGLEALTPTPQGDVTLEEIKEYIGDKILLDGIPAILFLDHYSREELMECVEKIVELFHPRLVLGISDEFPEGSNEESFERLKMVAEWCKNQKTG